MKASVITAILVFTAAAFSAPAKYSKLSPPLHLFGKRDTNQAERDCQNTSDVDQCEVSVENISAWDDSVNAVNLFLNTVNSLSGQDLTDAEFAALRAANAEPGFLAALQATPGLSQAGLDTATTLAQVFPAVPQNLVALTHATISVQDALQNINSIRYSQILPNIGTLWVEAAAAMGADTPGFPLGPEVCQLQNGNAGDAFN